MLVDANVLCEPTRPAPDARVVAWLRDHERQLVVNPVILGEIAFGIRLLQAGRKRRALEQWFENGVRRLHCVPWEASTGQQWAALLADLRRAGTSMQIKDSLIAATALEHDLTVATRNRRDFEKAGVRVIDPFDDGTRSR